MHEHAPIQRKGSAMLVAGAIGGLGLPEVVVILVIPTILLLPFYRIFSKAGYPGIVCLGMLVPLVNFALLLFLAFSEWPVLKELNRLRQRTPPL